MTLGLIVNLIRSRQPERAIEEVKGLYEYLKQCERRDKLFAQIESTFPPQFGWSVDTLKRMSTERDAFFGPEPPLIGGEE
jgi:hypothetical protein